VTDAVERLVNLAFYLADAREPVTAGRIRADVEGYDADQDQAAFLRMFERDKEQLREAGFTILTDSENEGLYHLDRSATFSAGVELSPSEAAAVRAAGTAMLGDPSFPFTGDLRLALAKIGSAFTTDDVPAAARLADEDPERQGTLVAELSEAAEARKIVDFGYTNSLGASAPHRVEPYGLFLHDGRWYLVGRDTEKDDVRTYTLARMADARANPARPKSPDFERPAEFDVRRFLRLPFQYGSDAEQFEAVLSFSPRAAWRAESLAAGQGALKALDGGRVEWRVSARSRARLLQFVIENGPGIDVVGPDELKAELVGGLEAAVAIHG
jgi:proteasome accessory factor B